MQYASILPPQVVRKYDPYNTSGVKMTLAHQLLGDPELQKYYAYLVVQGKTVIMDNGVMEIGLALNMKVLVELAESGVCNEMVLPDVFDNGYATLAMARRAVKQLPRRRSFRTMGVVHARDLRELHDVYRYMLHSKHVDVIAFPKVLEVNFASGGNPYGRVNAMRSLVGQSGSCLPDKPIHLLGLWSNPMEIAQVRYVLGPNSVRSVDSSFAAAAALGRQLVGQDLSKPSISSQDFESTDLKTFRRVVGFYETNLDTIEGLATGAYC